MGCIGGGLVHSILGARNAPAVSTLPVNLLDATFPFIFPGNLVICVMYPAILHKCVLSFPCHMFYFYQEIQKSFFQENQTNIK